MSAKHQSPAWRRTVRIVRAQVRGTWQRGDDATCWRCGGPIPEGMPYDVGHLDPHGGEAPDNAAPEHRTRTGKCVGNRNHGGRMGARITNMRHGTPSFKGVPW